MQDFILPLSFLCTECRPVAQWTPGLRPTDDELAGLMSNQSWEPFPVGPDENPDMQPPARLTARERWGSSDLAATARNKRDHKETEALERIAEETWQDSEKAGKGSSDHQIANATSRLRQYEEIISNTQALTEVIEVGWHNSQALSLIHI